jgi:hypothetical protein
MSLFHAGMIDEHLEGYQAVAQTNFSPQSLIWVTGRERA